MHSRKLPRPPRLDVVVVVVGSTSPVVGQRHHARAAELPPLFVCGC
jgi:hypothetical protein